MVLSGLGIGMPTVRVDCMGENSWFINHGLVGFWGVACNSKKQGRGKGAKAHSSLGES